MSICYIFPGQGSQYVGMGKDLYDKSPEAKRIFNEAEGVLPKASIKKLCFEGPIEELTRTANSQVCILVVSIAALEALKSWVTRSQSHPSISSLDKLGTNPERSRTGSLASVPSAQMSSTSARGGTGKDTRPMACAGLSLGELTALAVAGVMEFADAVKLVRRRGELMEEASLKNPGTMASVIGIDKAVLDEVCKNTGAETANLNCPGQIVISGSKEAVGNAIKLAGEKGARKSVILNVNGAFHSSFMKEAAAAFKAELGRVNFSEPRIPVVSNVTADYEKNPEAIKENLVRQLYSPVRWEDCVRRMALDGCGAFFEIGPGVVLKGLLRRINPDLKVYNIDKMGDIANLNIAV